jgi:hypothetical protein
MRSAKLAFVLATFAILLAPVAAHATGGQGGPATIVAPQYRIKNGYAKQLISQVATDLHGRYGRGWSVELRPGQGGPIGAGTTLTFKAKVNWGKGPHIMTATGGVAPLIAVPDVTGTINMQKAPGAPKGKARVTVLSPQR